MKLFPNKEKTKLYTRSMGKLFEITAIFTSDDEANNYMSRNSDQGVIGVTGDMVLIANLYSPGVKLK